jgi:hypothetical protein
MSTSYHTVLITGAGGRPKRTATTTSTFNKTSTSVRSTLHGRFCFDKRTSPSRSVIEVVLGDRVLPKIVCSACLGSSTLAATLPRITLEPGTCFRNLFGGAKRFFRRAVTKLPFMLRCPSMQASMVSESRLCRANTARSRVRDMKVSYAEVVGEEITAILHRSIVAFALVLAHRRMALPSELRIYEARHEQQQNRTLFFPHELEHR